MSKEPTPKEFAIARFNIAIHYVKRFYTFEQALEILKMEWHREQKEKDNL